MVEQIVGSNFPSRNSYGQDASSAPSSVPLNKVPLYNSKDPEAQAVRPRDPVLNDPNVRNWETRTVSAEPFPPAHGHRDVNSSPARVPSGNNRAVSQIAPRGAAKR